MVIAKRKRSQNDTAFIQTDTTVSNMVLSPWLGVANFTTILWQSHDVQNIWLARKKMIVDRWRKNMTWEGYLCLHPTTSFNKCGGPEGLIPTTVLLRNVATVQRSAWNSTEVKRICRIKNNNTLITIQLTYFRLIIILSTCTTTNFSRIH